MESMCEFALLWVLLFTVFPLNSPTQQKPALTAPENLKTLLAQSVKLLQANNLEAARDKLEKALFAVVNTPSIQERFAANGMHGTLGSKDFAARLAKEFAQWPDTIKKLGITAE